MPKKDIVYSKIFQALRANFTVIVNEYCFLEIIMSNFLNISYLTFYYFFSFFEGNLNYNQNCAEQQFFFFRQQ